MSQGNVSEVQGPASGRPSRLHRIVEAVAPVAVILGWPSAVVLFFARVAVGVNAVDAMDAIVKYAVLAFIFTGALLGALAFSVMGLAPMVAGEHALTGRWLLVPYALALGPTIVLALFFYVA
jgi:hypothetical protein